MMNRDFYNAILAIDNIPADVREHAMHALDKMNEANARRSSKPSKKAIENEPVKASIVEYLGTVDSAIAADVAGACEISSSKASALLRQLVEGGQVVAKDDKRRKVYALASVGFGE